MPIQTLEQRLAEINQAALVKSMQPSRAYGKLVLRADFAQSFRNYCALREVTFLDASVRDTSLTIENALHKKALEPIIYGLQHSGNLPRDVVSRLTGWEAAYLFAGMDTLDQKYNKHIPDFAKLESDKIIATLIIRGMDVIMRRHNDACAHAPRHLKGKRIQSELKLPYERAIRSSCYAIVNRPEKVPEGPLRQQALFHDAPAKTPNLHDDYYLR